MVRLASDIRLRQEYFGGLVYDTRNGNTLEVDKSTFQFLYLIKENPRAMSDVMDFLRQKGIVKQYNKSVEETILKLFELKIVEMKSKTSLVPPPLSLKKLDVLKCSPWLSAPETIHLAVTYHCDENCPDCYVARFSSSKNELNTHEALKLIDKIADWHVFQLAIGGGEPFIRPDLPQLVQHAALRGLSVHITTGKLNIEPEIMESVYPFIKNLQIGIRAEKLLGAECKEYIQQLQRLFSNTQRLNIKPGANLFLTKSIIKQLNCLITILMNIGFNRLILLRYKPPKSIERWKTEVPDQHQMKGLHTKISAIIKKNPQLTIRIDCALSFIQRYLSEEVAKQYGLKGCVAADRILALSPDGSAYPCSQLIHPNCYGGNLLNSQPERLWNKDKILRKYRLFHTKERFLHSWCGLCSARDSCGGCRIFSMDGLGADLYCPEPLLAPLTQIGRIEKSEELPRGIKDSSCLKNYPRWINQIP